MELKCPKCEGTDFIAEVDIGVILSTESNVGAINFNMIKRIVCNDLGCRHVLEDDELRMALVTKTTQILKSLKGKALQIK
jgi:hypothetical protein